jgi:hypothetical protein
MRKSTGLTLKGGRRVNLALMAVGALALGSCAGPPPGNPVTPLATTGPLAPGGGPNGAGSVLGAGSSHGPTRVGP